MKEKYIDLHVHSNESDGTLSPDEVIRLAAEKNLSAIALTDHDTVSGLAKARPAAGSLGLELVPGVELSTNYYGVEIHILGYYIDDKNPVFLSKLEEFCFSRDIRNAKMAEKLREFGFDISIGQLKEAFPESVLTRAHFARFLKDRGQVKSMEAAFRNYLGDGCRCYVPREKITPFEAIDLIKAGGGLSYFAHPVLCRMNNGRLSSFVGALKEHGLIGLEAIYSAYSPDEERNMCRLAEKYGLLISGGSDFHGSNKPSIRIGSGKGNLHIPYVYLEQLKNCRTKGK